MLRTDRDALICDLAETYGIFDYRALPGRLLATLCVGLRDNSRIKMRLSDTRVPQGDMLLAAVVDRLSWLIWMISKEGENGSNPPVSIVDLLLGVSQERNDVETYDSAEDFEAEWTRRTGVSHGR